MSSDDPTSLPVSERVALLAGVDSWHTPAAAGVPAIRMSDGPAGVRGTSWTGPRSASFPCGTALGATFDPDLVRAVGEQLGREARAKSAHVLLAPTVNLHRTPIGGRNFECMSEDPVLTALIAEGYVAGVQSRGVACCIKHFVGNDTEFERMTISSDIDERTLREVYLLPFERAVAAGVRAVMTGYNRLNGTFCADHQWLLRTVLRDEWGFDGVVVSDWFGMHSTVEALVAGVDIEMPGPSLHRGRALVDAVTSGAVDEGLVDEAVGRIADLARWTGAGSDDGSETVLDDAEVRAVQHRAAVSSTVLLANPGRALPWSAESAGRVALIGPYADVGRPQGGGSARVTPAWVAPIRGTLTERGLDVTWAPGCSIERYHAPLEGDIEMRIVDEHGVEHTARTRRTVAFWQDEPAVGLSRTFGARLSTRWSPDVDGTWTIGVRSVGACTVSIDGELILTIAEDDRGGSFFTYGSPERLASVDLVAGREVRVEIDYPLAPHPGIRALSVGFRPPVTSDPVAEAVALAAASDRVLLVVGTDDDWETESEDRTDIALPGRQDELIAAVAAANPNTVVVINAGSPVSMPWLDSVAAVMQIWFPGGAIGSALADVVLGAADPGGRLPVTFPRALADTPAAEHHPGRDGHAVYAEGPAIGHRWYLSQVIDPLFWFGHGLSYTTTEWSAPDVTGSPEGGVTVRLQVTNTGDRAGVDVVQVYVESPEPDGSDRALTRFVGSAKVELAPGETADVAIPIEARRFMAWHGGQWVLPVGQHRLHVGRSAGDLGPATVLTVSSLASS
ncbi:MAG: beta-glucosidase protein [Actinomycetota bacterium]